MESIVVSTHLDRRREEVFAFLDVLANHEQFTDHMLVDWTLSGPASGVGAKARMRANVPGPKDFADMEVIAAEPPQKIVEQAVGAKGKRRTQGTYTLTDAPGGGTHVKFELRYLETPLPERVLMPAIRVWLKRANQKAMDRLAQTAF